MSLSISTQQACPYDMSSNFFSIRLTTTSFIILTYCSVHFQYLWMHTMHFLIKFKIFYFPATICSGPNLYCCLFLRIIELGLRLEVILRQTLSI